MTSVGTAIAVGVVVLVEELVEVEDVLLVSIDVEE
jgi:hypothetical protein